MVASWNAGETIVTGDLITAAYLNKYLGVGGSLDYLKERNKCCVLTLSVSQTISNNTLTAVAWDTETVDTDNMHEGVTNPSRITIVTPGVYLIGFFIPWGFDYVGTYTEYLYNNGAVTGIIAQQKPSEDVADYIGSREAMFNVSAADYFEVKVHQASGGDEVVYVAENYMPQFWAIKVADTP